ncbi:outer membrane protein TolC [Nitrosomonas sp. Nm84]|uniref:TolC family protein n=1 Tax=Nitrosomonas sp. Nm84 TaxID=200124 RepID=UPI000D76495A|nr:TolC family protein [Nitrosomonas sp. Nm84]PXW89990.1 outer membrane protein TolC [Nitrosomonas sp. Nm84]
MKIHHYNQLLHQGDGIYYCKRSIIIIAIIILSGCAIQPKVVTEEENKHRVSSDLLLLQKIHDPVQRPISLEEATARALKYNLELQIELTQKTLAQKQLNLKSYDMLPKLVVDLHYDSRSNFSGARSRSLLTGRTTLEPSTSADKDIFSSALGLSWNILDFGVSYYRAQQAADNVLIQEEQKRNVINRIVQEVRSAYWRAVSYERLISRMHDLKAKVRESLDQVNQMRDEQLNNPKINFTFKRDLYSIERELNLLQRNLLLAKSQLAELMNIKPGTEFTLVIPDRDLFTKKIDLTIEDMEQIALESRPELRELFYKKRANAKEVRAAILQMLPGIELGSRYNYNSNGFLFNGDWLSLGAQLSWNLISIISAPAKFAELETKEKLLDIERLSMSMAVLAQVHVSLAQFSHFNEEYRSAYDYYQAQKRIIEQTRIEATVGKVSGHALIREELNTLLAEVRCDSIYSELENSYAGIYVSLGLDPIPGDLNDKNLSELTAELAEHWHKR